MVKKNNKAIGVLYAVVCASLFLMCSCSGSSGSASENEGTGSIVFSLQLPAEPFSSADGKDVQYKAASIDCDRLGIVSVEAQVYDEHEELIAQGGPWDCSLGEGIIYGIKAGNNRTVLLFLRDENHIVRYTGNKSEIRVIAGQTTDIGTIIVIEGEEEDNHAPVLTGGGVTPEAGVAQETFTYSVHYRDIDGHAASQRSVYIDGAPYTMSLTSGAGYDGTYTYRTTLPVDDHTYYFVFNDGYGGTVRLPGSEMYAGPRVRAVNNDPVAGDDQASAVRGGRVADGLLDNDYDPDDDDLLVNTTPVTGPDHGNVVLNQDGTFIYTHDGSETASDSFTYEVRDGWGGSATAVVSISVSLDPQDNHAPVLTGGGVTPEAGAAQETFTYSVHYRDIDGHAASQRSVYIDGAPYTMSLSSGAGYDGTYTYRTTLPVDDHSYYFVFNDGYGGTVRLPGSEMYAGPRVRAVNNDPVAGDDEASAVRGGRVAHRVLDNDYDPDDDDLLVNTTPVTGPDHGNLVLNQDGTFVYTHDGSETASDSFTYEVGDGWGGSAFATVSITVSLDPQDNHAPVLTGGIVSPGAGEVTESFTYTVYYSDVDGHAAQEKFLYIDGTRYDMVLLDGTPYAGTYAYETDLPLGSHEYYFTFTDGYGGSASLPESGAYQGPCVVAVAYFVASSRGSDDYVGSIAYPFATIGHAIDAVQGSGDSPVTIFIAQGSYAENLVLDSWESLSGGWLDDFSRQWDFAGNGITPAPEYETVIDGGQVGRCITAVSAEGVSLSGVTLFNGNAGDYQKGGSALYLGSCSADIDFCTIVNNTTVSDNDIHGGAVYNDESSPTFSRCLFADNVVTGPHIKHGGALYNYRSSPRIVGCIFRDNHAGCNMGAGGAIYNLESDAEIVDSVFAGNTTGGCYSYGAGIYNESSDPLITNCLFVGNTATGSCIARGGAVYNQLSSPNMTNCSFSLNSASNADGNSRGGGIYNDAASAPVITNSILWGDTARLGKEIFNEDSSICRVTYCDIDQDLTESDIVHHNIREAPLFVDASGGDLHLDGESPCIDAGTNDAPWLLETDFEGDPRIVNEHIDMGADEYVD